MNSLSWFLYFADAAPNLAQTISGICIGAVVLMAIAFIFLPIISDFGEKEVKIPFKTVLITATVGLVLASLIPKEKTFYLIAGSEAGEYVVTSPEGQEIINDIKAIIKSQIEELK